LLFDSTAIRLDSSTRKDRFHRHAHPSGKLVLLVDIIF